MPAHATRMLLLGAVAIFEPANAYQIRRELLSWQVDRWAHINPGSIYGGLSTLTRAGHLVRHDLVDGGREVAVYELAGSGRTELERLVVAALETVELYDRTAFMAAYSMLPAALDRTVVRRSLERRRVELERTAVEFGEAKQDSLAVPPHVLRGASLWHDVTIAELAWLREVIEELDAGRLDISMEPDWTWTPPPGDPGWQMAEDRRRYREILDAR